MVTNSRILINTNGKKLLILNGTNAEKRRSQKEILNIQILTQTFHNTSSISHPNNFTKITSTWCTDQSPFKTVNKITEVPPFFKEIRGLIGKVLVEADREKSNSVRVLRLPKPSCSQLPPKTGSRNRVNCHTYYYNKIAVDCSLLALRCFSAVKLGQDGNTRILHVVTLVFSKVHKLRFCRPDQVWLWISLTSWPWLLLTALNRSEHPAGRLDGKSSVCTFVTLRFSKVQFLSSCRPHQLWLWIRLTLYQGVNVKLATTRS